MAPWGRIARAAALAVAAVAVCAALAGWLIAERYQAIVAAPFGHLERPVDIEVPPGATARRIAADLEAEGIVTHPLVFRIEARRRGLATRIQAGEYEIDPKHSIGLLLERLAAGDTKRYSLALIEGQTFVQALTRIREHPKVVATSETREPEELVGHYDLPFTHPEGSVYPDTYLFEKGTTDRELVARARERLRRVLAEEWEGRSSDLPLATPYEALILASIIEKETAVARERPQIAGVFVRRLRRGMKLQTDPTVIYGLGDAFDGNLRKRDLKTDTPYNTYTRSGLPPTPIALVGRASIHAALHPDDGDTLYFVSRGDGTHEFSATYGEHQRAVRRFQLGR